jgi:hypothetical protein
MTIAGASRVEPRVRPPSERLRIVVLGYLVRGPLGGLAWHHLHYVAGLARLGHDVFFLEDSDDYESCYDPERGGMGKDPAYGLRFAADALGRLGLGGRWAYFDAHIGRWHGPGADDMRALCSTADVLMNVSGVNPLRPWSAEIPIRVLIDTDPVFTQVRHLTEPATLHAAKQHTAFCTFGENLPGADSSVPDDGLPWLPTRQPLLLDAWPVTEGIPNGKFTTVMQWDSYPPREYGGRRFGMKSDSFQPYVDLPQRASGPFELALGSASAPRDALRARGWSVVDPLPVTRDPWTYQEYIRSSRAEFSVAKHGYVTSRSGWFSERSACYLAAGRPVITQDTGFSRHIPTGAGLLAFDDVEDALAAVADVNRRYSQHCAAARELAAAYFDSDLVLTRLLEAVSGASVRTARSAPPHSPTTENDS